MAKRITAADLTAKGASAPQVARFVALFREGGKFSLADCYAAANAGVNLDWFAHNFLTPTALAAYLQATAPALAEYEQVQATALAAAWKLQEARPGY